MRKRIAIFSLGMAGLLFLSGCGKVSTQNDEPMEQDTNKKSETTTDVEKTSADSQSADGAILGACKEEKVTLPNYGDPGKRLKNCFMEYPSEPSRQDKSYYVVEDICGQFTQQFMENMLGEKITKIEQPQLASLHNCSYYLGDKEYLLLNLEYLKIENQKTFYEHTGDKMENNPKIPMENLVVSKDDVIREIYFVLNPQKFISLKPNSKTTISNEKFINLAVKIGEAIKDYK